MTVNQNILAAIKESMQTGAKIKVNLTEAAVLTGSGSGVGGNTVFDDSFAARRYANPFRMSARVIPVEGSDIQFVAKTGNATYATNPWGYPVQNNLGNPGVSTSIWQLPVRAVTAQLPIRTAAYSDINNIDITICEDLALEFSQVEAESMVANNDQAGTTTTTTGGLSGLRGLNSYLGSTTAAYGTSGTAITNGIHTLAQISNAGIAVTYEKVLAMASKLPSQYWSLPGNAWHIAPSLLLALRTLKDTQGLPLFLEVGDNDGSAVGNMFGYPVVTNSYLTDTFPMYLANWPRFLTIGDNEEFSLQVFEQSTPGFQTLYAEKRVVSTVRDCFAGVRMSAA